ncbi:hypothetical protein B0A48_00672 [Cryoendolithus antarcticus]|uniref:Uncharacterized protein n=1 Tax=Cryoendolithus antarcticus TaxID=1507870 RepID=A0A1V8TVB4_9PEZI|nr:hypothetical protein B0A48_00672 [Cryoendolithus antarcticus]
MANSKLATEATAPHALHDVEKDIASPKSSGSDSIREYNATAVHQDGGILSKLRNIEATMDRKFGIESEAIDRKVPEERIVMTWRETLTLATLWASGTMNLSCFATGFLGWEFGLSLKQNLLCCIFGSLLGGATSGSMAVFGAPTGLRQISISRYQFGWWFAKVIAALNVIQQIGWSAVGCITGGIALNAVADDGVSIALGVFIIAFFSMLVSFVGLKAILPYERWAWVVYLVVFLVILGQTGRFATNDLAQDPLTGMNLTAVVLSLLSIIYGSSSSWALVVSDYYVLYPTTISRPKVFILTMLGIALPTGFGMCTGAVVASTLNVRADWSEAYDKSIGYLIQEALPPIGWGKFILVLLVLSGINCNIINTYSAAISCQQFARPFAKLPRFIWTVICFAVILALGVAGRDHLLSYLQNFLSLLGYIATSYFVIVLLEHFVFRKGDFRNYDLDGWNIPARLPLGLAASATFLLGVAVWVLFMVQTWWIGPGARQIGEFGGDLANEITLGITLIAYVPLRWAERKYNLLPFQRLVKAKQSNGSTIFVLEWSGWYRPKELIMAIPTPHIYTQAYRLYSTRGGNARVDRIAATIIVTYCGFVFGAPLIGAALVSRNAKRDSRYAEMRPLSFRDCLPGPPLEDYAGPRRRVAA